MLSSLIARRWVGLQSLCLFRLKGLSIDEMVGVDTLAVCRAHRCVPVAFLLLWYSVFLLLNPCLCFISLLYLDLYVLGDDALIIDGWLRMGLLPLGNFADISYLVEN